MKKIILFAATIACMASCQNTSKTPAIDLANFDLSVAPNADFYEYATGGWQKNNPLKPEYSRYGSFDILRDNNEKRINELFSPQSISDFPTDVRSLAPGSTNARVRISLCVPVLNNFGGYGISTVCASTTPFGLALAPGLPWADEPSPRNLRFSAIMIPT